jgi:transposase
MSAFIKQYKARNGATVIQVVFKNGRSVIRTIHVGTAHNDIGIAELRAVAKDIIHEGQMSMDFGDSPKAGTYMALESAYSAVLWEALSKVYNDIGFGSLGDEVFKQLVLARIIEPTSKLDTIRVLSELGLSAPSNSKIHRTLKKVVDNDYRSILSDACFKSIDKGALSLLLYDVTTLYFEVKNEDGYRMSGMSKERRLDPQITIGLLVGRNGFPLEVKSFEGNRAEVKTIIEVLSAFRLRHGLGEITVTADAAILSSKNVQALEDMGYHYVIGSRIAKTPHEIAEYAKEPGQKLFDGQIFDLRMDMNTGKGGRRVSRRVIYQYKEKRARMDLLNIDKLLLKAAKMLDGKAEYKRNRFLKVTGGKKELNYGLIASSRLKAGIKGYVTDIDIPAQEVIDAYHQLFEVERSFRMSKSDLKARPVFHYTRDAIEAHLTIVFAALAVSRRIQAKTGISIKRFLNILRPIKTGKLRIAGKVRIVEPAVPPVARALLNKI